MRIIEILIMNELFNSNFNIRLFFKDRAALLLAFHLVLDVLVKELHHEVFIGLGGVAKIVVVKVCCLHNFLDVVGFKRSLYHYTKLTAMRPSDVNGISLVILAVGATLTHSLPSSVKGRPPATWSITPSNVTHVRSPSV